jgi:SAM-dependent methyltransferase
VNDDKFFAFLHAGLSRQAPGSDGTTQHLLELAQPTGSIDVLDIGCGPGRASLVIAEAHPTAVVTSVDIHQQLDVIAMQRDVGSRVRTVCASMESLPFEDESFDLVWSEGAIYIMGFAAGLAAWRRLLRPGGTLVVTEATWFTDSNTGSPARLFWSDEYPAMVNETANETLANDAGFEVAARYRLPATDWWDEYYSALEERLDNALTSGQATATQTDSHRAEINLYREHSNEYGYTGFVLRRAR